MPYRHAQWLFCLVEKFRSAGRLSFADLIDPAHLGNAAIARGAWEAGVKVASAYPGTPSTEISEGKMRLFKKNVVIHTDTKIRC